MTVQVDRERLVDTASRMINVHSFTGDEQSMAELMVSLYEPLGLAVQWQQVEDNRANALGTWQGAGGGPTLMFNGHMDTSYSGREPWLAGRGFRPEARVEAHTPRDVPPVYVAATAPKMQALAGEIADGCLTPSITTPAFVRYTREQVNADIDIGCTVVSSIHATDRDQGRDGAREIAGMYLANKVQNIQGSADTLLDLAGIEQDEIRPVAEAMEQGGRLAAKAKVSDDLLDKCKPIAGTPDDCIAAIEEYRDAGCTHVMLELWGADRHEQIRLFGEKVLPHFRQ